jgi:hypothetical protein
MSERVIRAVEALRADLEEVRSSLEFAVMATSIRPRLNGMLNWAVIPIGEKNLVQRFMQFRDSHLEGVLRGLFVAISASHEQFVRDLVVAGVAQAAAAVSNFDELSETLRNHNLYLTGRAFETVFGRRHHMKFDYFALSKNIGSCSPGARDFRLNEEVFATDVTTPTVEGLQKALDRIGVAVSWDDLARDTALQKALGTSGVRETSKAAQEYLDGFVAKRNLIVHGGRGSTTVVEADVEQALAVIMAMGDALGDLVAAPVKKR